jgi:hypothetical protein
VQNCEFNIVLVGTVRDYSLKVSASTQKEEIKRLGNVFISF